jgi:tyrosyl-tRNA synthetase
MSKSLGNYVGITEAPGAMFGKLMSISDVLMWSYFELLSDRPAPELAALRARVDSGALHPMDAKMGLAQQIVADYHGAEAAKDAADEFQRVFRDRQAPAEAPVRKIRVGPPQRLAVLLVQLELATSRSEAERLIKQGGVEVDGVRVSDIKKELDVSKPGSFLLRAGKKKFLRVVVE